MTKYCFCKHKKSDHKKVDCGAFGYLVKCESCPSGIEGTGYYLSNSMILGDLSLHEFRK